MSYRFVADEHSTEWRSVKGQITIPVDSLLDEAQDALSLSDLELLDVDISRSTVSLNFQIAWISDVSDILENEGTESDDWEIDFVEDIERVVLNDFDALVVHCTVLARPIN